MNPSRQPTPPPQRRSCCINFAEHILNAFNPNAVFFPSPEEYRGELLFFFELFADLSGNAPDYVALRKRYWDRVYAIYDQLPPHVDRRPENATDHLIGVFRSGDGRKPSIFAGKWTE